MDNIDCRGQACPGPVIQVKKQLESVTSGGRLTVLVDSEAARDNVARFAGNRDCLVEVSDNPDGGWVLNITAPHEADRAVKSEETVRGQSPGTAVVFITSDTLGRGDDKLGGILMEGFIRSLAEQDQVPDTLCLMNGGVRLAAEGSPVTDALARLTDLGCEVLVCGTCLDFFHLKENLAVGEVSNMFDIQEKLLRAEPMVSV